MTKITGRKNMIIGTVSWAGSCAAFFSARAMRSSRLSWDRTRNAMATGADGVARHDDLPGGNYRVAVTRGSGRGRRTTLASAEVVVGAEEEVPVTITVEAAFTVRGQVLVGGAPPPEETTNDR